jgi:hypothetical protein
MFAAVLMVLDLMSGLKGNPVKLGGCSRNCSSDFAQSEINFIQSPLSASWRMRRRVKSEEPGDLPPYNFNSVLRVKSNCDSVDAHSTSTIHKQPFTLFSRP